MTSSCYDYISTERMYLGKNVTSDSKTIWIETRRQEPVTVIKIYRCMLGLFNCDFNISEKFLTIQI